MVSIVLSFICIKKKIIKGNQMKIMATKFLSKNNRVEHSTHQCMCLFSESGKFHAIKY